MKWPCLIVVIVVIAACAPPASESEPDAAPDAVVYAPEACLVVVTDGEVTVQTSNGCDGVVCDCNGGCADVVVIDDEVVSVVCYSTPGEVDDAFVADGTVNLNDGETTQVVVDDNSGGDINVNEGDVTEIVGEGKDVSLVDGDVNAHQGDVRLRAVTVAGDVALNNHGGAASLSGVRVLGDLNVHIADVVFVDVEVFGDVHLNADGASITGLAVQGAFNRNGQMATCDGAVSFVDANDNGVVDDDEWGDALCPTP